MGSKKQRSKSKCEATRSEKVPDSPAAFAPAGSGQVAEGGSTRPSPLRRLTGGEILIADSATLAQGVAEHLLHPERTHPVLVLSTPTEDDPPLMDADQIRGQVGDFCDVVVLPNGTPSYALAQMMPNQTEVYGGAGRVYPVNLAWMGKPSKAPLRFCWTPQDSSATANRLVDDAYNAAAAAGLFNRPGKAPAGRRVVATFKKVMPDRHHALLESDDRRQVIMLVDGFESRVEPERLLRQGQQLSGVVLGEGAFPKFEPDPIEDDPRARVMRAYPDGATVLAKAEMVGRLRGRVLLHPDMAVDLQVPDESDLRRLVAAGDVILVRLIIEGGHVIATLADEDAPCIECVPVIPGGPPWLAVSDLPQPDPEPEPEPEFEADAAVAGVVPSGSVDLAVDSAPGSAAAVMPVAPVLPPTPDRPVAAETLAALRSQNASLLARLHQAEAKLQSQAEELRRTRVEAREAGKDRRRLRDRLKALESAHDEDLFDDPAEQLGHDIRMAWLRRFRGDDRRGRPLRPFRLSAGFIESVNELQGIDRSKIIDVLVEVLTDLAKDLPGRELHPLNDRVGGVQRIRHDGGRAWRCALQVGSASARRLHYWTVGDLIEFESVGVHDDGI